MTRSKLLAAAAIAAVAAFASPAQASEELAKKHNCLACHQVGAKSVGPAYKDIAKKYGVTANNVFYICKRRIWKHVD